MIRPKNVQNSPIDAYAGKIYYLNSFFRLATVLIIKHIAIDILPCHPTVPLNVALILMDGLIKETVARDRKLHYFEKKETHCTCSLGLKRSVAVM